MILCKTVTSFTPTWKHGNFLTITVTLEIVRIFIFRFCAKSFYIFLHSTEWQCRISSGVLANLVSFVTISVIQYSVKSHSPFINCPLKNISKSNGPHCNKSGTTCIRFAFTRKPIMLVLCFVIKLHANFKLFNLSLL